MTIFLTNDTKTILLLCGVLGPENFAKPLTLGEYNALVRWLISKGMRPEDLLVNENVSIAASGTGLEKERLTILLGRGASLAFAVEEWQRTGIWILSRSDKSYPSRYKKRLKDKAPPLLFGLGDPMLINYAGIAIVGSRNVDKDGEIFTRRVAEVCSANGMPIISGGARGVDQISMKSALDSGGISIGVLADNLLKKGLERDARNAIAEGRLLLISPNHPNAPFSVGRAMGRNKLIYGIANYGLVVSADHKKGGTWAGAEEELKRQNHIPLFVRTEDPVPLGNKKLLDLGAIEWPAMIEPNNLQDQLKQVIQSQFDREKQKTLPFLEDKEETLNSTKPKVTEVETEKEKVDPAALIEEQVTIVPAKPSDAIYQAVLPVLLNELDSPVRLTDLSEKLKVSRVQLKNWLQRAIEEGKVGKTNRPIRYFKMEII